MTILDPLLDQAITLARAQPVTITEMPTVGWQSLSVSCPFCATVATTTRDALHPRSPGSRDTDPTDCDLVGHMLSYHRDLLADNPPINTDSREEKR